MPRGVGGGAARRIRSGADHGGARRRSGRVHEVVVAAVRVGGCCPSRGSVGVATR